MIFLSRNRQCFDTLKYFCMPSLIEGLFRGTWEELPVQPQARIQRGAVGRSPPPWAPKTTCFLLIFQFFLQFLKEYIQTLAWAAPPRALSWIRYCSTLSLLYFLKWVKSADCDQSSYNFSPLQIEKKSWETRNFLSIRFLCIKFQFKVWITEKSLYAYAWKGVQCTFDCTFV